MENEWQLVLLLKVELEGGEKRNLKVLVDTGGEINLIRAGLIPRKFIRPAREIYDMHTVNGKLLKGGKTTVSTKLYFTQEVEGEIKGEELVYEATFWEADIEIEVILSHSWLLENKIGVFPHHKALALDASNLRLLYGIK